MVISINPLCSCNEIPQFAALQPPKVQTQRMQKTLSLSLFRVFVFYVTFQPSQSTYQKIAQKTFTFFFGGGVFVFYFMFFYAAFQPFQSTHSEVAQNTFTFLIFFGFVYSCSLCSCLLMSHFKTITFLTFHFMFSFCFHVWLACFY